MHLNLQKKGISTDTRSVQENFNLITSFIQDSADKLIPSKTSRSVSSVPWITPAIYKQIKPTLVSEHAFPLTGFVCRSAHVTQKQKSQVVQKSEQNLKL